MKGTIYVTGALADGGVTTAKIADDAVTTAKIADSAVTGAKIADNAIGHTKIVDGHIGTAKLADDAVTTAKIAAGAITNSEISANAIGPGTITSNAVTTAKIADEAVTLAKLPHGTSSNDGKFLRANNGADPTFETVNTDLVSDTSPQLGGDLDTNSHHILIDDAHEIRLGDSSDLLIYHEGGGGDNVIKNNVASKHLKIIHNDGSAAATFYNNTSVVLYNAGSSKFETTSNGIKVIGESDATAGAIELRHSNGKKNSIGTHFASNAYDSRVEIGISDGSTSGGTNRVASFSYAGLSFGTDTASANRLDDYEEGTWTPDLRFGGSSSGMSYDSNSRNGEYTRIGNLVTFSFRFTLTSKGSSSGSALVYGLPFNCADGNGNYSGASFGYLGGLTNSSRWSAHQTPTIDTNANYIFLRYVITGTDYSVNHNNASFTDSTDMIARGFYYAS